MFNQVNQLQRKARAFKFSAKLSNSNIRTSVQNLTRLDARLICLWSFLLHLHGFLQIHLLTDSQNLFTLSESRETHRKLKHPRREKLKTDSFDTSSVTRRRWRALIFMNRAEMWRTRFHPRRFRWIQNRPSKWHQSFVIAKAFTREWWSDKTESESDFPWINCRLILNPTLISRFRHPQFTVNKNVRNFWASSLRLTSESDVIKDWKCCRLEKNERSFFMFHFFIF